MLKELLVTSSIVALSVMIFKILMEAAADKSGGTPTNAVDVSDEHLYTDTVMPGDIKGWFIQKNPDGKHTNILLYPTEKNMGIYNINRVFRDTGEKYLIQAVFNQDTNEIVVSRRIVYNNICKSLSDLLEENNGTIIFD